MKFQSQIVLFAFIAVSSALFISANPAGLSQQDEPQSYDFDATFNQEMAPMDPTAPFLNAGTLSTLTF